MTGPICHVETTKSELKQVIEMLNNDLGKCIAGYATKNPELIMFLMNNIQREKDREFQKTLNQIT